MKRRILLAILLFFTAVSAKAQLVINELSQGSGAKEYVEFVVKGTRSCIDSTMNIGGWIFDDNPGWFGTGGGQGIAPGCMRFRSVSNWAAVPYGSLIVVYNSTDKNTFLPADDRTDANHDHVYILPDTSVLLERNTSQPPAANSNASFSYASATTWAIGGDWSTVSLNNAADGFLTVSPSALSTAVHSIAFGSVTNGAAANVYFTASSGTTVYSLTSSLYANVAAWSVGATGTNETPGLANGGANTAWIDGMRTPVVASVPSNVSATICSGQSYIFGSSTLTTAGTYTNHFSNVGGCDSFVTLNLTVSPTPSISGITPVQPTCIGNNGSLNINGLSANTLYSITYSRNGQPVSALLITSTAGGVVTIPNLSAGTYNNITVALGVCSTTSPLSFELINGPGPATPTLTSNSPVCEGSTLTLNTPAVNGATYVWTGPPGFSASTPNVSIPNATPANNGTYSVYLTVGGCNSATASTTVTVNPRPATPTAGATPAVLCAGATLNLTAATVTSATYTWTGPGGFSSTTQNPTRANITTAQAGYYTVFATVSGCNSFADSVNVTVNPLPAAPVASSNSPVCSGNTLNLTASTIPGATYTWSGQNGFTSTAQNPSIPNSTTALNGPFTVYATVNGCNSALASTTVTVNQTPAAPVITTNSPVCEGSTLTLSVPAIAGATYSLSGPVGFTGNTSSSSVSNVTAANNGTYYATVSVNGCLSPQGSTAVTITPLPAKPVAAASPATICEGATLNLTASTIAGASYTWTGPAGFTANTQNPTRAAVTSAMSGYYKVTATVGSCTSLPDSVNVTVNPRPAAPTASSNSPVCEGNTVQLTAGNTTTGATYTWTSPNGYSATGANPSFTATTTSGGQYTVTASLNGCQTVGGTTAVTITPRPVVPTPVVTDPTVCGGTNGSISFSGFTPGAAYTVTYVRNGSTITNPVTATAAGNLIFTGLSAGTFSITSIATTGGCASAAAGPFTLSDPAAPAAPTASSNSPICEGATLQLNATGLAGATFSWTNQSGFTSSAQNPTIANATLQNAGTYSVTQSVNGCTSAAASVTVTVNPKPATPVASSNSPVCSGNTLNLTASTTTAGATYSWTGQLGFASSQQNPTIANATPANGGNYSVTASLAGCVSNAAQITVTVNQTPALPVITTNSPVCAGSPLNLQATVSGTGAFTYTWTKPGGGTVTTSSIAIPNATAADGGQYTLVVAQNGCSSPQAVANVVVNPAPAIATATGTNPTGCATATGRITLTGLTANAAYTISYTRNGGAPVTATLTADASGSISIANLTAGTYANIIARTGTCASAPAGPVTLTDPAAPTAPVAGNNGPICSGATLNLTAATVAGATYSWRGPLGFTSTAQNPTIPNATVATGGTYYVSVTVGTCTSPEAQTIAVVNSTPAAPGVSANSPVCVGNTLTLNATGPAGATYSWNGPLGFTSNLQNPTIPNITAAAGGNYEVTAILGTCPSPTTRVLVSVVPVPGAPSVTTPVVYCQDAFVLPLTATGTNLKFYTAATGGTGVDTLRPSTATAGSFNYYVSQSSAAGCEGPRALIVVTVNPKPAPPVATTTYTFCQYSTATQLTATGTNVIWYPNATGNQPLSGAPTPGTQVPGVINYYVTQKSGDCESDRLKITVTVNAKPAPPTVQNPLFLCQNDSVKLTANGQNLLWYLHPTGGAGIPEISPYTGNVDSAIYYVTQTVNGCESDRSRLQVYVNYKPNGIIVASRPFLCAEDTISFTYYGNARPDAVYNWRAPGDSRILSGTGAGPLVVQYNQPGNSYVELTINNMGCISDVFRQPVTVRPLPSVAFQVKPDACVDEVVNVALTAITSAIDSFRWDFNNGQVVYSTATGGPHGVKWSNAGTKVISLTATSATCGSRIYRDTIEIHPNPDARISRAGNSTLCTGDSVELSVVNEPGSTYVWEPYQFFTDRAHMASTVYATPNLPGYIQVTVTSSKSCASTDSIYVDAKPCCEVYFPNAFSPNGDGRNDEFRPVSAGHHDIATFRIINRWGQVVYESKDERKGWDGTFNGREQDLGTYYYYLKYRCSGSGDYLEQKGELILMR